MDYKLFSKYKQVTDESLPLVNVFEDEDGNKLVVEPGFYYGLENIEIRREGVLPEIMAEIDRFLKKEHKVILTADFEAPFIKRDDFVYKELSDILDSLNIYFEDKSRGSDYGD